MKKIIVAIDGYSSCGKSTMAKSLARRTGYLYFDSGAMYRAVALYCLRHNLIKEGAVDTRALRHEMKNIKISFVNDPVTLKPQTLLNGENIEKEIRTLEVSRVVSPVAAIDFVRTAMVQQQRKLGESKGVVMDGRDIGTTVFPDAELKVFVTASPEIRARRRYDELQAKGEKGDYNEILENVKQRDYIDEHREISPLKQAPDAIILDNGLMTPARQDEWLYEEFLKRAEE